MWEAEATYNSPEEQAGCSPATPQPRDPANPRPRDPATPRPCVGPCFPRGAGPVCSGCNPLHPRPSGSAPQAATSAPQAKRLAQRDADMQRARQAEAEAAKAREG